MGSDWSVKECLRKWKCEYFCCLYNRARLLRYSLKKFLISYHATTIRRLLTTSYGDTFVTYIYKISFPLQLSATYSCKLTSLRSCALWDSNPLVCSWNCAVHRYNFASKFSSYSFENELLQTVMYEVETRSSKKEDRHTKYVIVIRCLQSMCRVTRVNRLRDEEVKCSVAIIEWIERFRSGFNMWRIWLMNGWLEVCMSRNRA